jgi:hypothetical protein
MADAELADSGNVVSDNHRRAFYEELYFLLGLIVAGTIVIGVFGKLCQIIIWVVGCLSCLLIFAGWRLHYLC